MIKEKIDYYTNIYLEKSDLERMRVYELLDILRCLRATLDRNLYYRRDDQEFCKEYHKEMETEFVEFEWGDGWSKYAKISEVKEVLATRKHIMSKADRSKAFTKKEKKVLKYKNK